PVRRKLDVHPDDGRRWIEVWNKIALTAPDRRVQLANTAQRQPPERAPVLLSAVTGEGFDRLADAIEARVAAGRTVISLTLDPADGAGISWLHRHTEVLSRSADHDGRGRKSVRADPTQAEQVRP